MYWFLIFNTTITFSIQKLVVDHIFPISKVSAIMSNKMTIFVIWLFSYEYEIGDFTEGHLIPDSDILNGIKVFTLKN